MSNFQSKSHLPWTFRLISWKKGTANLDLGGGQNNIATNYLARHGVTNLVYDPWRSSMHNEQVLKYVAANPVDTVTVNNVLNVIQEKEERSKVIKLAAKVLKPEGTAYFLIYEGNKSAVGCATRYCWQNNMVADAYLPEIEVHFKRVHKSRNMIVAKVSNIS
jgi:ubiquinone/menaquinone biosynthesis C-methylase UbiE